MSLYSNQYNSVAVTKQKEGACTYFIENLFFMAEIMTFWKTYLKQGSKTGEEAGFVFLLLQQCII